MKPLVIRWTLILCGFLVAGTPAIAQDELFTEAMPYTELSGPGPEAPSLFPLINPATGDPFFTYAPAGDVIEAHPAHVLTVFLPEESPPPDKRFPTIVYCTSGHFAQIPVPTAAPFGFLRMACEAGYVVITVGTTGRDSWPTCSQSVECSPPANQGSEPVCVDPRPPGCWDTNIWYEPDADPTSPWNDFNYFYGEKDLVWAVQHVKIDAATDNLFHVDPARIIVSGTSAGGIYAGFVAFSPNLAWSDPSLSPQSRTPTGVAGIVSFEPVVWMPAFTPSFSGVHWPSVDDPGQPLAYHTFSPTLPQTPTTSLVSDCTSRLIRAHARRVPAFFASGNGILLDTGFGRDGNFAAHSEDYDRYKAGAPFPFLAGDPKFYFPSGPNTLPHDRMHMILVAESLQAADETFHDRYSRVHVSFDEVNWNFWPLSKTVFGTTPVPGDPAFFENVPLLDGLYHSQEVGSVSNPGLAPEIIDWMDLTFCIEGEPQVYCRNLGNNYPIARAETMVQGQWTTVTLDMNEAAPGYDAAWLYGYGAAAEIPVTGGEYILCADDGKGELLGCGIQMKDANGLAEFTMEIPVDPAMIGAAVFTQAILYDLDGGLRNALTNAQDMVVVSAP